MRRETFKLYYRIKDLSEEQRFLRNQRRTVRLIGERIIDPYEAAQKHRDNRFELRHLYDVYAIVRGRMTPNESKLDKFYLDKYLTIYQGSEVHES